MRLEIDIIFRMKTIGINDVWIMITSDEIKQRSSIDEWR